MLSGPTVYATEGELPQDTRIIRGRASALGELYTVRNPVGRGTDAYASAQAAFVANNPLPSVFVYYPWASTAVETVPEAEYFELRTARNRNLITEDEQRRFRDGSVAIAGLSVGSAAVGALVATGGPKRIKIADPDIVETTNLNRLRATLLDVCDTKTAVAARAIWELDPYAEVEMFDEGVTRSNMQQFFSEPRIDVFIDEMDNIAMKAECRIAARERGIPVLMATDNGDSVIVDVERFDIEPERPLFHGRVQLPDKDLSNLTRQEFVELSTDIIDPTLFTTRQQTSILQIGTQISGVPQLGTAASIAGAAIAFVTRRVLVGDDMPSGRYIIGCDQSLIADYAADIRVAERAEHTRAFMAAMRPPKKNP